MTTSPHVPAPTGLVRAVLGRPRDWIVPRPRPGALGTGWIGVLLVVLTSLVTWPAVSSAGGVVAIGFYVGLVSITLMAWSFLLSVRIPLLEPLFGGLDRIYQVHRWAGTLSVAAMLLHSSIEPEVDGGIVGATKAIADAATDGAEAGQAMLITLVIVSLVRLVPYRWWRWTHKLLGVPFVLACWHTWTSTKPYDNTSGWGLWIAGVMTVGVAGWLLRVVGRDGVARGHRYRVASSDTVGRTTELVLEPVDRPLRFRAGQFAVLKLNVPGLREPHIFTIAAGPQEGVLRFVVRDLGDWTAKVQDADLVGARAHVEGPYGRFEPMDHARSRTVWIAGGVGITPFLSAATGLPTAADRSAGTDAPTLVYCVRAAESATAIDRLRAADAAGQIRLVVLESSVGDRFSADRLGPIVGGDLRDAHVAVCGPTGLVSSAVAAARRLGASAVETESFDIRSGVGPDVSRQVDALARVGRGRVAGRR